MSTADPGVTEADSNLPPDTAPHDDETAAPAETVVPPAARPPRQRSAVAGLDWRDWLAIGLAFAATFLLSLSAADGVGGAGALRLLGIVALVGAAVLLAVIIRDRVLLAGEREDWDTFEAALPRGTRLAVPDGMSYAAVFPPALDGLRESGFERLAAGGTARRAILGEAGDTHFCVFQHHPAESSAGIATVGLVSLHPDREYDDLPRVDVRVIDPAAATFDERFEIQTADPAVAEEILTPDNRAELMRARPFDWSIIDNQIVTVDEFPRGPGEVLTFIRQRIEPLARVTENIPDEIGSAVGQPGS